LYEEIEKISIKIKHMYERDTNVQEISDTFRNVLSQSMDKYNHLKYGSRLKTKCDYNNKPNAKET
jgi:hypothetical protein